MQYSEEREHGFRSSLLSGKDCASPILIVTCVDFDDMSVSRIVPAVFLIFLATIGWSQDPKIDSLKKVISKTTTDSVKVNSLIELSKLYLDIDLAKAIEYGNQARKIAKKKGLQKGIGLRVQSYRYWVLQSVELPGSARSVSEFSWTFLRKSNTKQESPTF